MFKLSPKQRAKLLKKAQEQLPDARALAYGRAVTGPDPHQSLVWMIGVWIGLALVFTAMTGRPVFIGILPLAIIRHMMNGPRAVVIADRGVAILQNSLWNGKPNKLLAVYPPDALNALVQQTKTHVCLNLHERVWLSHEEYALLRQTMPAVSANRY